MNPRKIRWFREREDRFQGELRFDEPMSRHTYYRIGGEAMLLVIPKSLDDLKLLAEGIGETGFPVFVMGVGSNLLVSDEGFNGIVVKAARVNLEVDIDEEAGDPGNGRLRTGSSVHVSSLLRKATQNGWGGLEFLTGVPGSVGGAVAMNAGTHLGESKDRLAAVEYFPLAGGAGEVVRVEGDELEYSYRTNHFLPKGAIVWAAEWLVRLEDALDVKKRIAETLLRRKSTQPIDLPSCGSVFKNPREHGMRSWEVMEKLGLRGHRIGNAQFSEKHPNFIVNLGGATAADVKALIDLAKKRAESELGIPLQEEVKYL